MSTSPNLPGKKDLSSRSGGFSPNANPSSGLYQPSSVVPPSQGVTSHSNSSNPYGYKPNTTVSPSQGVTSSNNSGLYQPSTVIPPTQGDVTSHNNSPNVVIPPVEGATSSHNNSPNVNQSHNNSPNVNQSHNNSPNVNQQHNNSPNVNQQHNNSSNVNQPHNNSPNVNQQHNNSPNVNQQHNNSPNVNQQSNLQQYPPSSNLNSQQTVYFGGQNSNQNSNSNMYYGSNPQQPSGQQNYNNQEQQPSGQQNYNNQGQQQNYNSSIFNNQPSYGFNNFQSNTQTYSNGNNYNNNMNNQSQQAGGQQWQNQNSTSLFVFNTNNSWNSGYAPPQSFDFLINESSHFTNSVPYDFSIDFQQGKAIKQVFSLLLATNSEACVLKFASSGICCTHKKNRIITEINLYESQINKYKVRGDISKVPMILAIDPEKGVKRCTVQSVNDSLLIHSLQGEENIYTGSNNNQSKASGIDLIKTYNVNDPIPLSFEGCYRFKTTAKIFKDSVKQLKQESNKFVSSLILYENCCELVGKINDEGRCICYNVIGDEDEEPRNPLKKIILNDHMLTVLNKMTSLQPGGSIVDFSYTAKDLIVKISSQIANMGRVNVYLI